MIEVRCRKQEIGGVVYQVPTNVSRAEGTRVCGWQVRFTSMPNASRYFADSAYSNDPQLSLIAAAKYADSMRPFVPVVSSSLENGMRWIWQGHYLYLECSSFVKGKAARRVYAGTTKTTNKDRQAIVWAAGLKIRAELYAKHAARNTKLRKESAAAALKKVRQ